MATTPSSGLHPALHRITISRGRFEHKPVHVECSCASAGDFNDEPEALLFADLHLSRLTGIATGEVVNQLEGSGEPTPPPEEIKPPEEETKPPEEESGEAEETPDDGEGEKKTANPEENTAPSEKKTGEDRQAASTYPESETFQHSEAA